MVVTIRSQAVGLGIPADPPVAKGNVGVETRDLLGAITADESFVSSGDTDEPAIKCVHARSK